MKFDFAIGNPPYQDNTLGENETFAPPVYNAFMDASYEVADKVELIHPARFLFNAGSTPKAWNQKMLSDEHFKVLFYEQDSSKVFANTDIKGGVAVTYHDNSQEFEAIELFTHFDELNSIMKKVKNHASFKTISDIVITRTAYRLTDKMHEEHPEAESQLSKGHKYDMSTNIFERLPQIFFDSTPDDDYQYIKILGREHNARVYKYVRREYINNVCNLDKYKIILPKSNGSGAIGEVLSTPLIGTTESFISIGIFDTEIEAENAFKYIKGKFSRAMLGILKITQDNPPDRWYYVPTQDFTENSDIDWSKSISEIDEQLYEKYGLSEEEIVFIETNVKEME
ncbi:MAG: Eco57I restriction-modification methylase domain-containing protein [Oscillospiraceae bacterium]